MKKTLASLLLFICLGCSIQAQQFTAATYNIRNNNANNGDIENGNGWNQRCPVIVDMIRFHDFDIFGTQEGLLNQLEDMKKGLPSYDYIGVGRDDGKVAGEFTAIFFKTTKFKLLNKGNFWMSTITDKPNKGWDAALPRICSWGEFQEIKTGFRFFFFNLHMDHVGVEARKESSKLILSKIKEMTKNKPVILTGDFNIDQKNESYTLLNTSGILKDCYELAPIRLATNGTFNSFNPQSKTNSRIDHIFVTKEFKPTRYGILTDTYWMENPKKNEAIKGESAPKEISFQKFIPRMPSDHFPVVVSLEFKK